MCCLNSSLYDGITVIGLLKPNDYYMYHQVEHYKNVRSDLTVSLCVSYGYQNKQRLFPHATLTYMGSVYCAVRTGLLYAEEFISS